jgi:hypothetical protein
MPTRGAAEVRGACAIRGSRGAGGGESPTGYSTDSPPRSKGSPLRPESLLAGLPRLVRVADETRWRGQASVATAVVITLFWTATWLLGEPVREGATLLAALVAPSGARRIRESLDRAVPPPRATVHETLANTRDRRMRLAGIVLTGVIAMLIFDRFTGGGGLMAGLLAGALGSLGAIDWIASRAWDAAERERETRVFVVIRPDALSPKIVATEVYETPRPGPERSGVLEPSPFDLDV